MQQNRVALGSLVREVETANARVLSTGRDILWDIGSFPADPG